METPAQTCGRLLAALEELSAQEAARLEARDFVAAVQIQERAAPLIAHLVEHGRDVADAAFRARVDALLARRERSGEWLAAQLARAKEALQQVQATQRRVAQMAPAYGRGGSAARQLSAVG